MNFTEGTVPKRFTTRVITIWEVVCWFFLELLQCIYFQNTDFLPASAKLAVKYRPGRWNTGRLATLPRRNWFRLLQAGHSFEWIAEPYAHYLSIIGIWLAVPYGRERQFAAPSSEPIAICFKVWWHFENIFSWHIEKCIHFWHPWVGYCKQHPKLKQHPSVEPLR